MLYNISQKSNPTPLSTALLSLLFPILLIGLLIGSLTGCSSTRHATVPPEVSLVDVQVGDISFFQTTLKITTKIRNEDKYPVTFSGSTHRLELNGIDIGKAVSDDRIRLEPLETQEVDAEVELSHLTLATRIQDIVNATHLKYNIRSEFYSGSNRFDRKTLRSESSGTLLGSSRL